MDYTNDPSTNQHDYDELVSIYSHVDSTSTVGSSPAAASVGNSPESWGALVSGSRADPHSTYVRHFADGTMVVTQVIWA